MPDFTDYLLFRTGDFPFSPLSRMFELIRKYITIRGGEGLGEGGVVGSGGGGGGGGGDDGGGDVGGGGVYVENSWYFWSAAR